MAYETDDPIEIVKDQIRIWMGRRGLTGRGVCERAGLSPNTLSKFLNGGGLHLESYFQIERALGLERGRLAAAAHTSPDALESLVSRAAERGARLALSGGPSIADFLRWYHSRGGAVRFDSPMADHIDIYEPPTEQGIYVSINRIGPQSLASQVMGTSDPKEVERQLAGNDEFCGKSARDHAAVLDGAEITDDRTFDVTLQSGASLTKRYLRAVRQGSYEGRRVVLTFAEPL
ncbi:MAG: helix-turn-helix transcriptional regulator [Pseudomonadota bacterium]